MANRFKVRDVAEAIKEVEEEWTKKIRKGRWGHWKYNPDKLTLEFNKTAAGHHSHYWVQLERCTNSAEILDWVFQIKNTLWCKDKDIADFLRAFDDLMEGVQSKVCPSGKDKKFDFRKHLIERVNPIIKKK